MMQYIYDIFLHLSLLLLLPYFFLKMLFKGKYRSGMAERFGFIENKKLEGLSGRDVAWFHAVSVGEARAVMPLLKLFRANHPDIKIVFSTVTRTGNNVANKEGAPFIDALIYFPLDLLWVVKREVRRIHPSVFIVVEKEFWPNFFRTLKKNSVPIIVVNGTVSERSFSRYRRFSFIFGELFKGITFLARTGEDAERAIAIGVDRQKAIVTGNLKFDMRAPIMDKEKIQALLALFGIRPGELIIVAGSTHQGEEKILLDTFKRLKSEFATLQLVIAPRHPERFGEVEAIISASGIPYIKRSAGPKKEIPHDVVLLDTIGELVFAYSLSTVAFVGGTLVDAGGHNLLEPAFFGKPVIYGPYLKSYLYMAELLEKRGGGFRVKDSAALFDAFKKVLSDHNLREKTGKNAKTVLEENRGATEKSLSIIEGIIKRHNRRI